MLHSIRTFLEQFLSRSAADWQQKLITQWHTIVGDLSHKMTLEKIDGSTLVIGVYDAAWMQELYLLSPLLIKKINNALEQPQIKTLQFKRVVRKKENSVKTTKLATTLSATSEIPLTHQEQTALAQLDTDLANSLAGYRKRINRVR